MKLYEITYKLRNSTIIQSFKGFTSNDAVHALVAKLSRRDKLFFKLLNIIKI